MKVYRKVIGYILTGILTLSLAGCGNSGNNGNNQSSEVQATDNSKNSGLKTIRIGSPTADATQLVENAGLALKLGYIDEELEKAGYQAEYVGFGQGGTAINEALASGQLDVAFVGDVPEVIAKSNGIDVELFASLNSEAEMGIVAGNNSGISSVSDLKGKKVVAAYGTVTHVYLNNLLEANGLSIDDVEIINDIANGGTLVASGNADAVVSTGSGVWQISNSGVGTILTTSQGDASLSAQFFAIGRSSYLSENSEAAKAIIRALQRSKQLAESEPDTAYEMLATEDNPKELFEKIYPSEAGFERFEPKISEEQIERLNELSSFLSENEIAPTVIDAEKFVNNSYYDEAIKEIEQ